MGEKDKPGKKPMSGERRKYTRYACSTRLKTIIDFNPGVACRGAGKVPHLVFQRGETSVIRDISQKGVSIELGHVLLVGMIIKMAIDNPVTIPIETGARVMWTERVPGKKKLYIVGLKFRYMTEKHRRNLDELIEFLQAIPE